MYRLLLQIRTASNRPTTDRSQHLTAKPIFLLLADNRQTLHVVDTACDANFVDIVDILDLILHLLDNLVELGHGLFGFVLAAVLLGAV